MKRVVFDFHGVIYDPKRGKVDTDVLKVIKSLYEQNISLYIYTSSSLKILEKRDKEKPFLKYFKSIIHDSQYPKSHPKSFRELFNTVGNDPSEIILIDDNIGILKQAQEYGILTIKYTDPLDLENKLIEILKDDN